VDSPSDSVVGLFSRAAPTYDTVGPRHFSYFADRLVEFVGIDAGNVVLDVATGAGAVLFAATERVGTQGTVVGIDLSPAMLARAAAASSPSCRGIATEEAVSAERTCAHGLRSPTSECLHFHDSSTSRSSAASISAATLLAPARLLGGRCRRWCAARRARPPAHSLPSAPRAPSAVMSTSCVRRSVCTTSVRIGEGSVRSPHEQLALCEPTAEAIELRRPVEMARGNSEGRVELVQMPATDVAAPVCSTNFN
jgi:hypothetical protein